MMERRIAMNTTEYAMVGRNPSGRMFLRTLLLHWLGKVVGIQFHIGGWPYGAACRRSTNGRAALDCIEGRNN